MDGSGTVISESVVAQLFKCTPEISDLPISRLFP